MVFPSNIGISSLPELIESFPDLWEKSGLIDKDLPGRTATWSEIEDALKSFDEYIMDELWPGRLSNQQNHWILTIEPPYESTNGMHIFTASGDGGVLIKVLERLPQECGISLVLINGEPFEFVKAQGL